MGSDEVTTSLDDVTSQYPAGGGFTMM